MYNDLSPLTTSNTADTSMILTLFLVLGEPYFIQILPENPLKLSMDV